MNVSGNKVVLSFADWQKIGRLTGWDRQANCGLEGKDVTGLTRDELMKLMKDHGFSLVREDFPFGKMMAFKHSRTNEILVVIDQYIQQWTHELKDHIRETWVPKTPKDEEWYRKFAPTSTMAS